MNASVDRLCLLAAIEGVGPYDAIAQAGLTRRLTAIVEDALAVAGVSLARAVTQDHQGKMLALLPLGTDERRAIPAVVRSLRAQSALEYGRPIVERLRLRVALTRGAVWPGRSGLFGGAINSAERLLAADALSRVVAERRYVTLVLAVADDLYGEALADNQDVASAAFRDVLVGAAGVETRAWLLVAEPVHSVDTVERAPAETVNLSSAKSDGAKSRKVLDLLPAAGAVGEVLDHGFEVYEDHVNHNGGEHDSAGHESDAPDPGQETPYGGDDMRTNDAAYVSTEDVYWEEDPLGDDGVSPGNDAGGAYSSESDFTSDDGFSSDGGPENTDLD